MFKVNANQSGHNFIDSRFGSKEQLWRAAVDRSFAEILDSVALETTVARPGDPPPYISS
jgi:hypothetical protein